MGRDHWHKVLLDWQQYQGMIADMMQIRQDDADCFSAIDREHMRRAIDLAGRGLGRVSPNPPVGCVIAMGHEVVAEGWHQEYGGPHAEVNALAQAGERAKDATAYVTLMPCAHFGKTPPCTSALIEASVKRVVVAVDDPNPQSGDGRNILARAGIRVEIGLLRSEAAEVMRGFLKHVTTGLPFLTLKYAMTLDGKIATNTGDSRWISCEESRGQVQAMRARSDGVMVGIGTALADDPRLTVREPHLPQPWRIIVDSTCRLLPKARVFKEGAGKVMVVTTSTAPAEQVHALEHAGATVVRVRGGAERVDLPEAMRALAGIGLRELLCEGGAGLGAGLLEADLVDRVVAYIAPKIVGGTGALSAITGRGVGLMSQAIPLTGLRVEMCGSDIRVEGCTAVSSRDKPCR